MQPTLVSAAMDPQFIKGDARLGDTRLFTEALMKKIRTSTRMQAWNLVQYANLFASYCDDVTRTAIETAMVPGTDNFDCGEGGTGVAARVPDNRRFTPLPEDAGGNPSVQGTRLSALSSQ